MHCAHAHTPVDMCISTMVVENAISLSGKQNIRKGRKEDKKGV